MRTDRKGPLLGAHVSIAGGLHKAPARGVAIGCDAIQIFTKNQVQWKAPPLSEEEIAAFKEEFARSGLACVVVHDSYLINLASPDEATRRRSLEGLVSELIRAEQIGAPYLVMHPGAHMGEGEEKGLRRIAQGVSEALGASGTQRVVVLYETTAGQGSVLGYTFEQLASLMEMTSPRSRVGVCLDTCHAFAAGYELRSAEGLDKTLETFHRIIGLEHLRVMHLNDSRKGLGTRIDRHEHIGKGEIGLEGFRILLREKRLQHLPMLLETPGGEKDFAENLKTLRELLN
ncbi:MAG: deoxyribonuclease IV [candidate division KSB1 bacterium]|nr:deoxyribonuclease IV [candidate division KSB1 bacterium]MDZ7378273.1 deoxyribonuclease IV [candidate division KSB1 bacterium]MDZ7392689.1 deoxyribonuclease IV [candidate division KSB1 bacterium]MDZ7413115.1 deoxyribonuclease IV [candidate division KSB1 bacterium]